MEKDHLRGVVVIDDYLSWEEVAKIEVNRPDLPGMEIDTVRVRYYPLLEAASHVIGYVGPITKEEAGNNLLLNHPDFKVGKNGIERTLEQSLRGEGGIKRMEVNAYGAGVRELSLDKPKPGLDVALTIDGQLQEFAYKRLTGIGGKVHEGSGVVVIDVETGGIVSMVSMPGFNGNLFLHGISHDDWNALNNNPDVPLINKAITAEYPPGSTFKPITALAAMMSGTAGPQTRVNCPGYYYLGSKRFHCWKEGGHGSLNMEEAIMQSCNVYFYQVGQRAGIEAISKAAEAFGLGKALGVELVGERNGLIPSPNWKQRMFKQEWYKGETVNTSIGQGYVLVTPLQLAVMSARIATGKKVTPHLVDTQQPEALGLKPNNYKPFEDIDIDPNLMEIVRSGMRRVVNDGRGTAFGSRIPIKGQEMAGKTGTAQVRARREGVDATKIAEKQFRTHSLFTGFAPARTPKFAIGVVIEHGGAGSQAAAPVARDILTEAMRIYGLPGGEFVPTIPVTPAQEEEVETPEPDEVKEE